MILFVFLYDVYRGGEEEKERERGKKINGENTSSAHSVSSEKFYARFFMFRRSEVCGDRRRKRRVKSKNLTFLFASSEHRTLLNKR